MTTTVVFSWKSPNRTLPLHHAWMWAAAVHWAKQWFERVVFVGDCRSREMLVEGLELPFDVVLPLPSLPDELSHVRDITKLAATKLCAEMFGECFHHDFDAHFRHKPPEAMLEAPFVCEFRYTRNKFNAANPFESVDTFHKSLPSKLCESLTVGLASGIMGGADVDGIIEVCEASIQHALLPENREAYVRRFPGDSYIKSVYIGEMAYGTKWPTAYPLLPEGGGSEDDRRELGWHHVAGGKENFGLLSCMADLLGCDFPKAKQHTYARWHQMLSSRAKQPAGSR